MSPADWLLLATVCAVGAMSPGPSLALVLKHALHSRASGWYCAVAHGFGVGCYAALAVSGMGLALRAWPALSIGLHGLGGAFMLWLAWQMWRGPAFWAAQFAPVGRAHWQAIRDGLAMSFLNPKIALVFLVVFAPFVPPDSSASVQTGVAVMAGAIDGSWYAVMTVAIRQDFIMQSLRKRPELTNRIAAIVFALLALRLWWELVDGAA